MSKKAEGGLGIIIVLILIFGALIYFKVIPLEKVKDAGYNILGKTQPALEQIGGTITNRPSENNNFGSVQVYFCPGDLCESQLVSRIDSASVSVHCAFYDLNLPEVKDALKDAVIRGVDPWVVMDDENYNKDETLKEFGGMIITDNSTSDYMHNKFCVIDKRIVITGSMNPTTSDATQNNNNLVIITDEKVAEDYENEFLEMKQGLFGKDSLDTTTPNPFITLDDGTTIDVNFCPENNCEANVLKYLDTAKVKIHFMTFSFTSEPIQEMLLSKKGLDIKGVYDNTQAGSRYSTFNVLQEQGILVRKDGNPYLMHHKVWIIDETYVITGSFNPTAHANEDNDENLIIIKNEALAKAFEGEFEKVWGQAT